MRSTCTGSAAGMLCKTTSGSGGLAAFCCEEHPAREIPASILAAVWMPRDLPITGPKLPHHRGNVVLRRPDQCDDPSNHAPTQKQIEQEDREEVPFAPRQCNDRRQKIHHERQTEEEVEEEKRENHGPPSFP